MQESVKETEKDRTFNDNVHHVLAHSYSTYFGAFLFGLSLDLLFKLNIFTGEVVSFFGMALLGLGTVLVMWAQKTSRNLHKTDITKDTFYHGPYCFTRSPTHWGLFLLMLGFGLIANAFFVILLTIISFFITRLIFLKKEENLLVEKYGSPYLEYKKSVKF